MGLFGFGKSKEEKKRLKDKAEEEFLKYRVVNISPETARKIKNDPDNISHHVIPDTIAHGKRLKELERKEREERERQEFVIKSVTEDDLNLMREGRALHDQKKIR